MVAFPFGGHPTFRQYLDWAVSQGCTVQVGVDTERSIGVTKIFSPDREKWAIQAGTLPTDYLTPTDVGRLDRRLGILSPWFGAPLDS
jgi:hypothetical protein